MAQAFSHDGIRSLWSQCEESKKLHFISQDRPSLVGQLNARDLSITSGSDLRYWKWNHIKDGICGDINEVAELLEIRCLQIDGKYEANKLKEGLFYEVQYVVMLKDNHTVTSPVKLALTLPDGTKHESTKNLMEEPRNHMIGLKLGHFLTKNLRGDIKFSLVENGSAQKRGSSHPDIHALWSYGQGIEMIHCPSQNNKSIVSNLSAKDDLWITWGSDCNYWEWTTEEIGGECVDAAKLSMVCWLELGGKYDINTELTEGMTYEVKLVVKVLGDCDIEQPVSFSITTPDGCKQEHTENMLEMPRNEIIGITFGEFQAQESYELAEVEFSMKCTDDSWKYGIVVIGALVVPKF